MGTAKAKSFGLFPAPMCTTDPPDRLHTDAQVTASRNLATGPGECAQPRTCRHTNGHVPHGPRPTLPSNPEGTAGFLSAGTTRDCTAGHPGVHTEPLRGLAFRAPGGFPGRYRAVTTRSCRAALITTNFRRPARSKQWHQPQQEASQEVSLTKN